MKITETIDILKALYTVYGDIEVCRHDSMLGQTKVEQMEMQEDCIDFENQDGNVVVLR